MNQQQNNPAQEMAERAAESLPALQAAAAAVGLQDHQRMLRDHARRVRDSHRMGAKAAGLDEVASEQDGSNAGDSDMGDIIISGDITNTYLPPSSAPLIPPQAPAQEAMNPMSATSATSGLSNLAKAAVIGASLLSGGIGAAIPTVANLLLNKPAAPVAAPPAPTKPQGYEIRLVPEAQGVGSSK